jgi:4-amino-4-deoxy-L-arabinose transferase-like glycosyltransferase
VAFAVVYSVVVWWPTRDLPYHWDSASFVVDASRDLLATHFHPLVAGRSDFAHPPLFVALLALAWKLFGDSRLVSHLLVLPALPAAMIAAYRLGTRVCDRAVGASAAALFGGVAVVVAEYGQVYMDLPVAAALAWGLVAWVEQRRALACVLFCLAALAKIPAPLTVPGALLVAVIADRRTRRDARAIGALLAPFAVEIAWLAYHRAATGWTLSRRPIGMPRGPADFAGALGLVFARLLLGQWRWVLLAAALAAIVWVRVRRRQSIAVEPVAPLVLVVAAGVLFFGIAGEFGLRYGIYLLPAYFVAALYFVRRAIPRALPLVAGAALLFALFVTTWHPRVPLTSSYVFHPDEDLAYLDLISIGQRSASWLERKRPDAEIYGAGPESYQLTEPWQGYVNAPLHFSWCKAFERHPDRTQIVVVHGYHPQQPLCRRITEELGATPIRHYESGGKWLELYALPVVDQRAGTK